VPTTVLEAILKYSIIAAFLKCREKKHKSEKKNLRLVTREIAAQIVVGATAFVYFSPHLSFTQTRPIFRKIENLPQKSPPHKKNSFTILVNTSASTKTFMILHSIESQL